MSNQIVTIQCMEQKYLKRGKCNTCGICKYCIPAKKCSTKINLKPWIKQQKLHQHLQQHSNVISTLNQEGVDSNVKKSLWCPW